MAFFIRIERKQDLEWLQSVMQNSVSKLRQGSSQLEAASENIVRVHESVINAVEGKEATALGITDEFKDTEKVAAKPKPIKDDYIPNLCKDHPKSTMKRVPGTDCKGCWSAYKRLHPEKYDVALRTFKAKQRAK